MQIHHLAALWGQNTSSIITDALGVVAACSFLGIALYIGTSLLGNASRRRTLARGVTREVGALEREPRFEPFRQQRVSANEEAVARYAAQFETLTHATSTRFAALAAVAQQSFAKIAEGYAAHSYGHEGENAKVRARRFAAICERQWSSFKGDIGFLTYPAIQEHLRYILDNHRHLQAQRSATELTTIEMTPELLRSQEIAALLRVVPKDKIGNFQSKMLDAIELFRLQFEAETKNWVNDRLIEITRELRRRDGKGVPLSETEYAERFKQLKSRLDVVARLSDYLAQNTQRIGEDGLALSQIIYVGTVLNILMSVPEWFSELELERGAQDSNPQGDKANMDFGKLPEGVSNDRGYD